MSRSKLLQQLRDGIRKDVIDVIDTEQAKKDLKAMGIAALDVLDATNAKLKTEVEKVEQRLANYKSHLMTTTTTTKEKTK